MEASKRVVDITNEGAIVFEGILSIDGFYNSSLFHTVTHIHSDHTRGLKKAIKKRKKIVGTPLTIDMLEALGYPLSPLNTIRLEYGREMEINNSVLRLEKTNHIPGSSMVIYNSYNGVIAYTSDFKLPGTYIVEEPDILVIDATYGFEEWRRPWQEEIEYILSDIVLESLSQGPVHIYAYNGKIQEVMLLLRRHGVSAPFLAPLRPYILARTMTRHGLSVGEIYYEYDQKAQEILRDGWYVLFLEMKEWKKRKEYRRIDGRKSTHILLTGWEFNNSYKRLSRNEWVVSFSDHADFEQLVEYVVASKPKQVVVDVSRSREAGYSFAKYLSRKLHINAVPKPVTRVKQNAR